MIVKMRLFGGVSGVALLFLAVTIRSKTVQVLACSALLAGGLLLAYMMLAASAHAAACNGASDDAHETKCVGGSTSEQLTYVGSNPDYEDGDFTLHLDNHDVTAGGIVVQDTDSGNAFIILENDSDVGNAAGRGIEATADEADEDLSITILGTSSVTGSMDGISALSLEGGVSVTTAAGTTVSGTEFNGITAQGLSGDVTVTTNGDVAGGVMGILAEASGAVAVTTGAGSKVTGSGTNGIAAESFGDGAVTVETGADSSVDGGDDGIDAVSASGAVTVTTGAGSFVDGGDEGILANSTAGGAISVTVGANSQVVGADRGISALATSGTITIENNGTTVGSALAIDAASEGGAIKITNNLTIENLSLDPAAGAIRALGGAVTIDNNSVITGRIATGNSDDVLNNSGIWNTEGFNTFGGGSDVLNNSQAIVAVTDEDVAETTFFTGLETLNNTGEIILQDQSGGGHAVSDRLRTDGDYHGQGEAQLHVDAFLGGPESVSDVLEIGGNTSGVTRIFVNDTNLGSGSFTPSGILVVDVIGTAEADDFVLAEGPIDKGLFIYDLVFNNTDQDNDQFLLMALPTREAAETLAMVAASQEIWRETAGAWEARQQAVRDRLSRRVLVTAVADPPLAGGLGAENGLWFSALGSWIARDSEIVGFDASYDQSIQGFAVGADFALDMGSGNTLLFGVLAGYVDSSLNFDASPTQITADGATLGIYASLLRDAFFANLLIKADLLGLNFSAPSLPSDTSDNAGVTSFGARADLGYRLEAGDVFFEPMISLDAISTAIEEFSVGGTDVDSGTNESFRGAAGLRLGLAGERMTASLTGQLWNVFATDNQVLNITDDGLEGVYGEVAGQIDVDLSQTTVLFAKGGVLFSDDITKPSVSGGFTFTW